MVLCDSRMTVKLRQLECLCAVVAADYNLSEAARGLCASQPTVSRQLQLLEEDLGFQVLVRSGNSIKGLTREGRAAHERAQRIVHESRQLGRLRDALVADAAARLTIATTHYHARYTLLDCIRRLHAAHPHLSFSIVPGSTAEIHEEVLLGQADVGLCAAEEETHPDLVWWPCFEIRRVIITPTRHPLLRIKRPSLEDIARYPLITYDRNVSAGWRILDTFAAHNLKPEVVLSAAGAEVIKAYVAARVGIAFIQERAFDRASDRGIRAIPADHLFAPVTAVAMVRRGTLITQHLRSLLTAIAPHLSGARLDTEDVR
jgi:DNA-binding transcriptional LysR family regulator